MYTSLHRSIKEQILSQRRTTTNERNVQEISLFIYRNLNIIFASGFAVIFSAA